MSIESAADRATLLADFGVACSWQVGLVTSALTVLFDNGTVPSETGQGLGFLNRRATITLRADDVPAGAGAAVDIVTIGGATYHPKNSKPDGSGFVIVTLEAIVP